MKRIITLLLIAVSSVGLAQGVKIAPVSSTPDASAMLDVESTDKGVLIPRMALSARNVAAPVVSPASSLLVFNTTTAGVIPFDVRPGFYYWDATVNEWQRVIDGTTVISDDQNIDSLTLTGTTLTTYIENGASASIDLLQLATNSTFLNSVKDSLVNNTAFLDSVYISLKDSLLLDTTWLNAIQDSIDTDFQNLDSLILNSTILTAYIQNGSSASTNFIVLANDSSFVSTIAGDTNFTNALANNNVFISSITNNNAFVDSLLGNTYFTDSIYSTVSDSILNDNAWLTELGDSIDNQNLDSANLNGTVLGIYIEDGNDVTTDLIGLASDSTFVSTIGSDTNFINTLTNDSNFISSITGDSSFVDSLLGNVYFTDSIYSKVSDSLLNDNAWLTELGDSIDNQNLDSANLNGTVLGVYIEDGNDVTTDLIGLASDSNFVSTIGSDTNFINTLTNDSNFISNITGDSSFVDSLLGNTYFTDSLYTLNRDSLILDTNFLNAIADSIDSDVDSVVLVGDTSLIIYEDGKAVAVNISALKDSSEWVDGSLVGLTPGNIYARKALLRGDTVVIDVNGNMGVGNSNPSFNLDVDSAINAGHHYYQYGSRVLTTRPNGIDSADNNLAIGYNTLRNTTIGSVNNVAIGTNALDSNLSGANNVAIGTFSLQSNRTGNANVAIGNSALVSNQIGSQNTAVGVIALRNNVDGNQNNAFGRSAMDLGNTGDGNSAFGNFSLRNNIGDSNVAIGNHTLLTNTTGNRNVAIGNASLYGNVSGNDNIGIGTRSGLNLVSGNKNIIIGSNIDFPSSTNSNQLNIGNILYGTNIDGVNNTLSTGNIGIGTQTPTHKLDVNGETRIRVINDTNDIVGVLTANAQGVIQNLPYDTLLAKINDSSEWMDGASVGLPNRILARQAYANGDTVAILDAGNVGIGTSNPQQLLHVYGNGVNQIAHLETNTAFTYLRFSALGDISSFNGIANAGSDNMVIYTNGLERMRVAQNGNVGIGTIVPAFNLDVDSTINTGGDYNIDGITALSTKPNNSSALRNTAVGYYALDSLTTGIDNTGVGYEALLSNTIGARNTAIGSRSLRVNSTGIHNTALGFKVLGFNQTGNGNTGLGKGALFENISGNENTAIGFHALDSNLTGNRNIGLGNLAGANLQSGDHNIVIGDSIFVPNRTGSNQLNIGNIIYGTSIDGYGSTPSIGNIGIGTQIPTHKLDVNGETRIRVINDTNDVAGVLTANAQGVIQNLPYDTLLAKINDSSEWVDGSLVGLTQGKIYARKALLNGDTVVINAAGSIGIGVDKPLVKLHVENGDIYNYKQAGFPVHGAFAYNNINNQSAHFIGFKTRGTKAMPSYIDSGDVMVTFQGRDGVSSSLGLAAITIAASENHSATNLGADMVFTTTPNGSITPALRMKISENGDVGIATNTPTHKLDINGETRIRVINDTTTIANVLAANTSGVLKKLPYDSLAKQLKDTSKKYEEWIEGGLIGATTGRIYANRAFMNGDTVVIKDNGFVGIGEINPARELHVKGRGMFVNDGGVVFSTSTTDNSSRMEVSNGSKSVDFTTPFNEWIFNRNTITNLRFNRGGGSVIIGTNSTYPARLVVNGLTNDATTYSFIAKDSNSTANIGHLFKVRNDGFVGVGAYTPQAKFHVMNDADATYDSAFVVNQVGNVGFRTTNPYGLIANHSLNYGANGSGVSFTRGINWYNTDGGTSWAASIASNTLNGVVVSTDGATSSQIPFAVTAGVYNIGTGRRDNDSILIVRGNGNIGVNTKTPSEKLEVVGNILASGTIVSSDKRYKRDIYTLDSALAKVLKLRGVNYFMKDEYKDKGFGDGIQIGVIAQEVEEVYPELVNTNEQTGYKAVDYSKFTPILIEAIKEQQAQIEELKQENKTLKVENTSTNSSVEQLRVENEKINANYNQLKAELEQIRILLNKGDVGTK